MQLTITQVLGLGSPGVSILFSLSFIFVWNYGRRKSNYLLLISAAFVFYALAATSQILFIPQDTGLNALVSGGLFMSSLFLLNYGVAKRYQVRFDLAIHILVLIGVLIALAYFFYENRNIIARIYILNFSVAGIILISVFRIRSNIRGALIDRIFFWTYLLFGISFFPRTVLSITQAVSRGLPEFSTSPFWLILQLTLLLFAVLLALVLLAAAMLDIINALQHDRNIDSLTKLYNRRSFEERGRNALASDRNEPISLVMFDLDNFKAINDNYGHAAGDMVLAESGNIIRQCARKKDIAGRFGGEEFIVLLPGTNLNEAARFAHRVRTKLANTVFSALTDMESVTASFGVVELLPKETLSNLVQRADIMLYEAKNEGKNRVALDTNTVKP
ncbi:GGDEF domain-containing protein [Alcaligenaceae bacterium CGII-47]|nr:GGDEF domain-containing protein [Alcaligenaceae bacterium CGII-47]